MCPITFINALDIFFRVVFWGYIGVMPFFSNAPLATTEGHHVNRQYHHINRQSINGRRHCSVWTVPLKIRYDTIR